MGKESRREAVLMAFARDPSRSFSPNDVMKSSGVSPSAVYKNLKELVASGEIVKEAPGEYRWPTITDATSSEGEESAKTAPDLIPPAPAPGVPPPEQPADAEAAPMDLPPQVGPPPFAGLTWIDPDDEIEVLEICVLQLGRLGPLARDRVMTYLASRFMVDWPDAKEK